MKKKLLAILSLFAVMLFFSGSACNHEWEPWTLGETEMTRVCSICHTEESAEIDREVYLLQQLQGHWDFDGLMDLEGHSIPAYYVVEDSIISYFRFNPDGTGEFYDGVQVWPSKYQYDGYDSEWDQYLFSLSLMPEEDVVSIVYDQESSILLLPLPNRTLQVFDQNQDLAEELSGIWAASGGGGVYSLELHEDRTFAAEIDEAFTGTWHLCAPVDLYGDTVGRLLLEYEQDGTTAMQDFYISFYPSDSGSTGCSISYDREDGTEVLFSRTDATRLEAQKKLSQSGDTYLSGQWTSTSVTSYSENGTNGVPTFDYSISFTEDGTFTASLDQERTGTWSFEGVDPYGSIFYELYFDGISGAVDATFHTYDKALSISGSFNDAYRSVSFAQMNEAEKAARAAAIEEAKTMIAGDWTSGTVDNRGDNSSDVNTGYVISFSPDGTFTANLEEGTAGRWSVGSVTSFGGDNIDQCNYNLEVKKTGKSFEIVLSDGYLTLYGEDRTITFGQYTEEDLKMIEEGPSRIVGAWSSERDSLTVNPDGTYTSTLNLLAGGTWYFYGYEPERGLGYIFWLQSGDGYMFYITPDGKLNIRYNEDGESQSILMTKE